MTTQVEQLIDVSDLEPPEPLVLTLHEAEALPPGAWLRMRHRRHPCLLYDNLAQRGFSALTHSPGGEAVEVFIWRNDDAEAEEGARRAFEQAELHP